MRFGYMKIDNLGDSGINEFLLPALFGRETLDGPWVLGCGSLLGAHGKMDVEFPGGFVFSTGYQYRRPGPLPEDFKVVCVRGALTARAFGIHPSFAIADLGILVPIYCGLPVTQIDDCAVVLRWDWHGQEGPKVRSARLEGRSLSSWLKWLLSFKRIVTDCFHAAVLADAYRIPWFPMRWELKWTDHFGQLGIGECPKDFTLSSPQILKRRQDELLAAKDQLLKEL